MNKCNAPECSMTLNMVHFITYMAIVVHCTSDLLERREWQCTIDRRPWQWPTIMNKMFTIQIHCNARRLYIVLLHIYANAMSFTLFFYLISYGIS